MSDDTTKRHAIDSDRPARWSDRMVRQAPDGMPYPVASEAQRAELLSLISRVDINPYTGTGMDELIETVFGWATHKFDRRHLMPVEQLQVLPRDAIDAAKRFLKRSLVMDCTDNDLVPVGLVTFEQRFVAYPMRLGDSEMVPVPSQADADYIEIAATLKARPQW